MRDLPETGALLRAPKKAPPCRTDTTFAERLSIRLWSAGPSAGRMPNFIWKYFDCTIPPATPLMVKSRVKYRQSSISHFYLPGMTEDARVIAEQDNAPVSDEGQP